MTFTSQLCNMPLIIDIRSMGMLYIYNMTNINMHNNGISYDAQIIHCSVVNENKMFNNC